MNAFGVADRTVKIVAFEAELTDALLGTGEIELRDRVLRETSKAFNRALAANDTRTFAIMAPPYGQQEKQSHVVELNNEFNGEIIREYVIGDLSGTMTIDALTQHVRRRLKN